MGQETGGIGIIEPVIEVKVVAPDVAVVQAVQKAMKHAIYGKRCDFAAGRPVVEKPFINPCIQDSAVNPGYCIFIGCLERFFNIIYFF